ncbi:SDR family oxidoreductase [Mucilaginibacter gilvus]|uniref:SDR family NAD(P)-dependent oxidoreductase n=1 Tax=Mucilaginibacter gilvus TaxID=2305909 RepID=A0A3S3W4Q7_9SPHI|nr:SDR family NAD(P)-dependent oxidoreductase [Mucilaginibacter gilvus]RWY48381.1 SDR family NAD(P)-dependent oxidoreductase [Mucilaginibacter gilvus]
MKTSGNTILITGAASGIGLEIAKLFSQQNNKIIMADRSIDQLKIEASKLENAVAIAVELTDENDMNKLIQTIKLNFSDLNIAILNAGAANDYSLYSTEYNLEYAKSEIHTNYIANVRLTHALEPLLSTKTEAAFVVTTSGLAFVPNLNYPTYSATKAALHSFALASRLALKRKGSKIKFFDLMPPLTETPLAKGLDAPKITAAEVASWFIDSFEKDELEIHVGDTEKIYQLFLRSPEEAFMAVNP